jgi:hypothetical protein
VGIARRVFGKRMWSLWNMAENVTKILLKYEKIPRWTDLRYVCMTEKWFYINAGVAC